MEILVAAAIGLLTACGLYLMLRGRTFSLVLGLSMLSYACNLFIFAMGRLAVGAPPLDQAGTGLETTSRGSGPGPGRLGPVESRQATIPTETSAVVATANARMGTSWCTLLSR